MSISKKLSNGQKLKLWLIFVLVFIVGITVLAVSTLEQPLGQKYKPVYEYGGEFTLQSYKGEVSLKDYRGKVVVAYFGFLNCTEACPVSMGTIVSAIGKLTHEERDNLQAFFISVDPDRDDIASLTEFSNYYAKRFSAEKNPNLIMALTGTKEQIRKISDDYGVFFDLVDLEGSGLGYTVDHSSRFYMIDGDGKLLTTMNHSTTPTELAAKIREMQADIKRQKN